MLKDLPILMTLPGMDLAALTCYEHKRRCLVNSRAATSFKGAILDKVEHFLLLYVQRAKHTLNNCGSKLQYE